MIIERLLNEVRYKTSRSSGPGGQHVNKTESRVELQWNIDESTALDENQKALAKSRLRSRLTERGLLIMASERSRSQLKNREDVTGRFVEVIKRSLKPVKKRKPTRPTLASQEKRLEKKKRRGALKTLRGKSDREPGTGNG